MLAWPSVLAVCAHLPSNTSFLASFKAPGIANPARLRLESIRKPESGAGDTWSTVFARHVMRWHPRPSSTDFILAHSNISLGRWNLSCCIRRDPDRRTLLQSGCQYELAQERTSMTCLCWPGRETDESSVFSQIGTDEPRPHSPAPSHIPLR